ncbi:hypothetical protein Tco_0892007 [Tanacetum coccineum]|uniref:Uncharacterized protein n=1 Tax=Tanacetum coccineum TaxID=301880 RepID=A0ABQ5C4V0_9ASTR
MKAHLAPTQPTQVNKINSSFEICSCPYDTQCCMKNPEQAFVEYVSSRIDEAGDTDNIEHNEEQRDTPQLELKDTTDVDNLGSNRDDEGIEWSDVEEPLDLVDTMRGNGVAGIKRCRRDLSGDGVRNLATASGRGRHKEDLESFTWRRRQDFKATSSQ